MAKPKGLRDLEAVYEALGLSFYSGAAPKRPVSKRERKGSSCYGCTRECNISCQTYAESLAARDER